MSFFQVMIVTPRPQGTLFPFPARRRSAPRWLGIAVPPRERTRFSRPAPPPEDERGRGLSSGPATVAVAEQNGNDGNKATGVVTGIHMTANGPQLIIGGQDIALTSISDVEQ